MNSKSFLVIMCLMGIIFMTFGCSAQSYGKQKIDYKQEMRGLIKEISSYGRTSNKEFKIIVNNGTDLLATQSGKTKADINILNHIDGVLLESYYYGWEMSMDAETPLDARTQLAEPVTLLREADKVIFSIDYCQDIANVNNSYTQNKSQGIISFAADSRQLDSIPTYPPFPNGVNHEKIAFLQQAKNMLVLLNQQQYHDKVSYLEALQSTNYDLLVIDAYYNDTPLTAKDVQSLQVKQNGGTRLVLAYISVGEAEDYRAYWQRAWGKKPPAWLGAANPDWPGNYRVQYWDKHWKNILFGSPQAYLDGIMTAGFNGVFLDTVDAYQYFLE